MRRTIALAVAFGLALTLALPALAEPLKIVSQNPPVQPGVSSFVLHSDRIGRDFAVTVNMPGAIVFLPGQKLPVIYALDGGLGVAGPQGSLLSATSAMEPAIVVSVGYLPGQTGFRTTDLSHNKFSQGPETVGGGGATFEAFLLEDLKPFIEAKYPADPARSVLFGHSLGGLFAANVFADKPDAFYGYIIGSASAWADPTLIARVAAAAPKAQGRRVYLAVGEREGAGKPGGGTSMTDGYNGLLKALKGHPGVILKAQVYKGETHVSYYPRLVTDGFPHVLPPGMPLGAYQARLPDATLAKYVGDYRLPGGRTFSTTVDKDGVLYGHVMGFPPIALQQNGPDRFYAAGTDANIAFDATGATLAGVDGGTMRAERAKAP
jgi:predicted alpha/beta superfamily hydrolase